jgi:2-hydroxychromene-2-carboxylate isomerase
LEFNHPKAPLFPISSTKALRCAIAARAYEKEEEWIFAVYHAYWVQNQDIAQIAVLEEIANRLGMNGEKLLREQDSADVRAVLMATSAEGQERGAFGAPTFFYAGEMFWGKDRLTFVEDLITAGEIQTRGVDIIR